MIYLFIGLIVGFVLGWVLKPTKQTEKVVEKEALRQSSGQAGFISESVEEKQKNLEKAREFIAKKAKENPGEIADASHGARITNDDLQKALGVSDATIVRYLNDLESEGLIKQVGKTGKYTYYETTG